MQQFHYIIESYVCIIFILVIYNICNQETKKMVGAVTQHIVFKEYLPSVIGPEFTSKFNLLPLREGYYTGII